MRNLPKVTHFGPFDSRARIVRDSFSRFGSSARIVRNSFSFHARIGRNFVSHSANSDHHLRTIFSKILLGAFCPKKRVSW